MLQVRSILEDLEMTLSWLAKTANRSDADEPDVLRASPPAFSPGPLCPAKLTATLCALAVSAIAPFAAAQAAQTYLYDSQGRLIAATTARPGANGVMAPYLIDDADNRQAYGAIAVSPPPVADRLVWPYTLLPGQKLTSPNGQYTLTLETSGDLVLNGPSGLVWHSCTGQGRAMYVRVNSTGRLQVYDTQSAVLWTTPNAANAGAELILQNSGTAVLQASGGGAILWSSTTQCL